jgi:hypothetical protein
MFLMGFTESLMTYATGRRIEYSDMPTIRQIVRDASKKDNKLSAFVLGVVNSPAFKMGMAQPPAPERRATDVAPQR